MKNATIIAAAFAGLSGCAPFAHLSAADHVHPPSPNDHYHVPAEPAAQPSYSFWSGYNPDPYGMAKNLDWVTLD